jgi:hypothetical protein
MYISDRRCFASPALSARQLKHLVLNVVNIRRILNFLRFVQALPPTPPDWSVSTMNLNNLEEVIAASTTTSDHGKLATALRAFMKRDVAESILASTLPNDVDPFTVLNPNENTLGYLYVL